MVYFYGFTLYLINEKGKLLSNNRFIDKALIVFKLTNQIREKAIFSFFNNAFHFNIEKIFDMKE